MKIMRLTYKNTAPVYAEIHEHNDKRYYNLKHGGLGTGLWKWSAGINPIYFPVINNEPLPMDRDDYVLIPAYKNKSIIKDKKDNIIYNISRDDTSEHKNDILLLWELPIKNFIKVTYSTSGEVIVIGEGISGKFRGGDNITAPFPVLEIVGDVVLTWEGVNKEGDLYKQDVTYNYNLKQWDIPAPIITKK